jgi:undecaprenyl diphosphate synthase
MSASAHPAGAAPSPKLSVPRHVAIIMDGNGRWARQRGLPRLAGHRAGTKNIRKIVETSVELGIEVLTLYAFSTENWQRPGDEVNGLLELLGEVIDGETDELRARGARVRHIGTLEGLPPALQRRIAYATESTRHNTRLILNVAFNYGGRAEIVQAIRRMLADGVAAEDIDEARVSSYLYTNGQPDPDLIIRTGGEWRLSNFLLWQAAYAEYYSTPTLWPEFGREHIEEALEQYALRQRRFGGV